MPLGGVEGPFLYMLAMLPLMSWIAREYPQLARTSHTPPAQAYCNENGHRGINWPLLNQKFS